MIHTIDLHFLDTPRSIAIFAIPDANGLTLVECGPDSTYKRSLRGLTEAGFDPADVHTILLTHIHFDHAGAAWRWAARGTNIYVHPRGLKHMIDPTRLYGSAKRIYGEYMDTLWGRMEGIDPARISAIEDRQELPIGGNKWIVHHTPGHAKHHIAWQLGDAVFTGDVGGAKIGDGPVVPPCPPPDIDIPAWKASIERLASLKARRFYLTHFGQSEHTEALLSELEARLDRYAEWIRSHAGKHPDLETLVPAFSAHVEGELQGLGVNAEDLEAYRKANPAYMSVSGLLRALELG